MTTPDQIVNVRYMVDDVQAAIDFYTKHLDFEPRTSAAPAFADVTRGNLRLLLSGPASSAGRPVPDGAKPGPGGRNRIHLLVDDITSEVARLRDAGLRFRNDIVTGPGGCQHPARGPLRQRDRAVPTRRHLTPACPTPARTRLAETPGRLGEPARPFLRLGGTSAPAWDGRASRGARQRLRHRMGCGQRDVVPAVLRSIQRDPLPAE
jgi:catechol 2,3-dioxygenase-like lactoylglutathione lyase family enzyme